MKAFVSLKNRLTSENTLTVQSEGGYISEVGFEWKKAASKHELLNFERKNSIVLPESFKEFLLLSNGATLFKDIKYGQWGCTIYGLDDLLEITNKAKTWGYDINSNWLVFASWIGDCDVLIFDLRKSRNNENNYIIDGNSSESVNDWQPIKGDFSKWFDRLVVAQGCKYWRWY